MEKYLVVTIKSWNIENYNKTIKNLPGDWFLISNKDDFTLEKIDIIKPDKIFFIHWSWIIPKEIFEKYECILFHMTDLPYGRGGSPLQNLIVRGIYNTKISALRVIQELDAGDIYLKKPLDISIGNAEEIFKKASEIISIMIKEILSKKLTPKPQKGEIVRFNRRRPDEGNLIPLQDISKIHDYIRMLDGEGYPRAFIENNKIRYEFYDSILRNGFIEARIKILKKDTN